MTFWHMLVKKPPKNSKWHYVQLQKTLKTIHDEGGEAVAELKFVDNDGNTALHLALENGHFGLAQLFLDPDLMFTSQEALLAQTNKKLGCHT